MKWKNVDSGAGVYFITGTVSFWAPLLERVEVCSIVCEALEDTLTECDASLLAWVVMPEHLHLVVYLPEEGQLHRFNQPWRGRSARLVLARLRADGDVAALSQLAGSGEVRFWKEQARTLGLETSHKLSEKVDYIYFNPVRRGLVDEPGDWQWSSFRFYEYGEQGLLPVDPSLGL